MNMRERALTAIGLGGPDKVPFHAYESPEHAIRQFGRRVHEMYLEPELLPEAMIATGKKYHNDLIMMRAVTCLPGDLEADLRQEGGILLRERKTGDIVGHVEYDRKTIIYYDDYVNDQQTVKKLDVHNINKIPDAMRIKTITDYRNEKSTMRTLELYKQAFGGERLLIGWGAGQTANILSSVLGETEAMIAVMEDPGLCRAIMARRLEQVKQYYLFQKSEGIEIVYTGDAYASCSLYSPETYRELFFEYHKKTIDFLHSIGMKALLHICGKINGILEDMAATGADVIESLDRPCAGGDVELAEAKRRVGDKVCLKGNLDAVHEIEPGPPEKIYDLALQALHDAGPGGYILSTEQITIDTPAEHVQAMVHARDDFAVCGNKCKKEAV